MDTCCYCEKPFERAGLRPYGPAGALTCHPCGSAPEHLATTEAAMNARFDAAVGAAQAAGQHVALVVIGGPDGPSPSIGDLPSPPRVPSEGVMFGPDKRPPEELCELVFTIECLRRLGFKSEQIDVAYSSPSVHGASSAAIVGIRLLGRAEHKWKIATTTLSFEEFTEIWPKVVDAWNALPSGDEDHWGFHRSKALAGSGNVAIYLVLRGEMGEISAS